MLLDLNNTLKALLVRRVPLDPNEVEISFECPKREWSAKVLKPTVNLYLFDVREDRDLRQNAWQIDRGRNGPAGQRRAPIVIQVSYFITVWAREVADEHMLLWRVLAALMRELEIAPDLLHGQLRELGPPIRTTTAQADGVLRNPGEFWNALDNDLKPAVIFAASMTLDLNVLIEAPLVFTRSLSVSDFGLVQQQHHLAIGGTVRTRKAGKDGRHPPIPGARVTFPQLGISVLSDDDGRFVVTQLPEGLHRVRVAAGDRAAEHELQVPSPSYDIDL